MKLRGTPHEVNFMKKNLIIKGTLENLKRLHNSYYGNPRYYIEVSTGSGSIFTAKTESNASVGYIVDNYLGKSIILTYHVTKAGNFIVTHIAEA